MTGGTTIDRRAPSSATRSVARVYDRIAFLYDLYDAPMNALGGRKRRRQLIARAHGKVLEVGIGTGANLDLYPAGIDLVGIDVSPRMLAKARRRASRLGANVALREADIERLPFPDATFDTVVATCVFCSVADPARGLDEVRRILKAGGSALLLEHVRPENPVMGRLADLISPLVKRLVGPELNRNTEETVARSGLRVLEVRREAIWREIVATRD
jgi:ubiquinone/menaquinone biosynthesis C-methylase UbiE